ncbi:MAG: 2-isopropylmalate synthase [Desulfarculales bacterium]|jgi:2-isopropylmalate synthase|nr:2-isopropylmalate synthase [Desulfarculales bacterium]
MNEQLIILDTTLRDGEQALQASLTVKEKLQIALALQRMKVDIIEAGFPISSPGDFESVRVIAGQLRNSRVCALARCLDQDIDMAAEALKAAEDFRIHTFLATSQVHIRDKLKMTDKEVLEHAVRAVKRARNYTDDVEFSCEDAGRTSLDFLCRMAEAVIKGGATTINIADTVGYTTTSQFANIIASLFNRVSDIDKVVVAVHCHDDLGMAVANSIAAVEAGARQVEGTVNGLGERAGNCALEEFITAVRVHENSLHVHTNIDHTEIYRTSQMISQLCNTPVPAHKAVVGSNVFSHSSGIHQDGVLKNRCTYEIISPDSIGMKPGQFHLTSRSGRAALRHRLSRLGYHDTDYDLDQLYPAFLKLTDKKGRIFDEDLEALVFVDTLKDIGDHFHLECFSVQSGSHLTATASVKLSVGGIEHADAATGNGPVDAVCRAINRISKLPVSIVKYQLQAKGQGENALGQVDILASDGVRQFHGIGLATDIVEASAIALVHALNHAWRAKKIREQKYTPTANGRHINIEKKSQDL